MNEFTKEQLIKKAQEQIAFFRHTKITGEGRAHVNQCAALFEIALAALTAEPVSWTDEVELRDVEANGFAYLFTVNPITPHADPRRIIKLYTVQPALESRTVTVKLPLPRRKTADDYVDDTFEPCDLAAIYNACRLECEVKFKKALTAAGIQVIEGEG